MTTLSLQEQIKQLQAEKVQLLAAKEESDKLAASRIRFVVSEKTGAICLTGLGRFPVTLYLEQWLKLLDKANEMRAFLSLDTTKASIKQFNKRSI